MQVTAMVIALVATAASAGAQDVQPGRARPRVTRPPVDFWGDRAKAAAKAAASEPNESLWAEPIAGADGRMSLHVPPRAVIEFLDNPTRETALKYVAWQTERMKRLRAAAAILRELKEAPAVAAVPLKGEILYFSKPGCPWCDRQDKVLQDLQLASPDLRIERVVADDRRWTEYGVTVTPTLVVANAKGRKALLRGFASADDVTRAIQEVNRVEE